MDRINVIKKMFREVTDSSGWTKNRSNLLRRVAVFTIALLLVAAFTAGGTWAYLADTETSTGNTFIAGTLNLSISVSGTYSGSSAYYIVYPGGDGTNGSVVFDHVAPDEYGTINWVLTSSGSIGGTLTAPSTITFNENGVTEPETSFPSNNGGGNGDLDDYLMVTLQIGVGADEAAAMAALNWIGSSTPWAISGLETVLDAQSVAMAASGGENLDTIIYVMSWSLPNNADINIVQSDTAQIDINFTLTQ